MRDLILGAVISGALAFGLYSAPGSILVLNWIWFQRPYDFSSGFLKSAPLFMVALAIAIFSNALRGQFRLRVPHLLWIYYALLFWTTVSAIFAFDSNVAWQTYTKFLPAMWLSPIVVFSTIHTLQLLKQVLWVSAGGIGINGVKTGLSFLAQGGAHVTENIDGFVGDNNGFALVLCIVIAMLMGLRATLPKKWWAQTLFFAALALIMLCIIYTKSRGAFATIGIIALLGGLLSRRYVRNTVAILLLAIASYLVIPAEYFDRLQTVRDLTSDESAMGRFENWDLAWEEALEHPVVGVGPGNHQAYNLNKSVNVVVRVAHNTYMQVLGELGFVGLSLYLLFVLAGLVTLIQTWRAAISVADQYPDLVWVRDTAFWLSCGYVGYLFGSALLNMLYIEFPWYFVFYGIMLRPLVNKELVIRNG